MKLIQDLLEATTDDVVTHLNCSNCQFTVDTQSQPIIKGELNEQGGVKNTKESELTRARKVRLITLPGDVSVTGKALCTNPKVKQWVTKHMWCTLWNAPGTIRAFDTEE